PPPPGGAPPRGGGLHAPPPPPPPGGHPWGPAPDEKTVRELTPDLVAVAALSRRGVIVTAAAEDPAGGYDYVSRCFFPRVGIDEDPVTGSAHTALAPFWSARIGRTELTGLQASARSGLVGTSLRGDRTLLTGRAVTVIDGELLTTP
ncbi:PhzF family phenazine biosynthesis protein, partial [Streptomyces sp. NPDC004726]